MVDIIKGLKWAAGWKDKTNLPNSNPMTPEELREHILMKKESQKIRFNPKRGEGVEPTIYPLSPVKKPRKIKKLPSYLKKTTYRKGRVN